ncbi:MAG: hypothetical protein AAFO01_00440 [Pseudomonadota bacterium]
MTSGCHVLHLDSATRFDQHHRGQMVICGSHGGVYCAYLAARAGLRAIILNDASGGLDRAGEGGLGYCGQLGMAAAVCGHHTARIGDGSDMAARGQISGVNDIAASLGVTIGMSVSHAAERLQQAPRWRAPIPELEETRRVVAALDGALSVVCMDSVSLVTADDIGQIVLTGSHGGLMGGRPEAALKIDVHAAFFNDAGVGLDEAGLRRLPALDQRDIAAATVDAMSARIGNGLSTYEEGRLSYVNTRARHLGLAPGMTAKDAVERLHLTESLGS